MPAHSSEPDQLVSGVRSGTAHAPKPRPPGLLLLAVTLVLYLSQYLQAWYRSPTVVDPQHPLVHVQLATERYDLLLLRAGSTVGGHEQVLPAQVARRVVSLSSREATSAYAGSAARFCSWCGSPVRS